MIGAYVKHWYHTTPHHHNAVQSGSYIIIAEERKRAGCKKVSGGVSILVNAETASADCSKEITSQDIHQRPALTLT